MSPREGCRVPSRGCRRPSRGRIDALARAVGKGSRGARAPSRCEEVAARGSAAPSRGHRRPRPRVPCTRSRVPTCLREGSRMPARRCPAAFDAAPRTAPGRCTRQRSYTRPSSRGARRGHDRPAPRPRSARRTLRPPQGRLRLFLHRDVGALLLLRDEGAAAALPAAAPPLRRPLRAGRAGRLRRTGVLPAGDRRTAGRPLAGHAQGGGVRRAAAGGRAPGHGGGRPCGDGQRRHRRARRGRTARVLPVAGADHPGRGIPQAQHLHHRRAPVPAERPAPRFGLLAVLRRHQPRRAVRLAGVRLPGRNLRLEVGLRRGRHRHAARTGAVPVGTEIPARPRRTAGPGAPARTRARPAARMGDLPGRAAGAVAGRGPDVGGRERPLRARRRSLAGAGADDPGDAGGAGVVRLVRGDALHARAAPADGLAAGADLHGAGVLHPVRADLRLVGHLHRPHADQGRVPVAGDPRRHAVAVVDRVAAAGAAGVRGVGGAVGPAAGLARRPGSCSRARSRRCWCSCCATWWCCRRRPVR